MTKSKLPKQRRGPSARDLIAAKKGRIDKRFEFSDDLKQELKVMLDAVDGGELTRNERPSCDDAHAFAKKWGWQGGKDTFVRMIKKTFNRRSWLDR